MICSVCTTDVPNEDVFCENCGAKLRSGEDQESQVPGCSCGACSEDVDEDGFCLCCGRRLSRPASDHIEEVLSPEFAAVSDRGLRHDRNEDRFALVQVDGRYGLVVCDGVSSTSHSEVASALVSIHVARELESTIAIEGDVDATEAMRAAIQAAATEMRAEHATESGEGSPSTTLVAALVLDGAVTVGWAGDSRAYWIDATGSTVLTRDHSWVNEAVAAGMIGEVEARSAPQAHAITRWIGADVVLGDEAEMMQMPLQTHGTLLLCSDGLWNYLDSGDTLLKLVTEAVDEDRHALAIARRLVTFAKDQGGRDNVTVAVLHLPGPGIPAKSAASIEQMDDGQRKDDTEESENAGSIQG